MTPFRFIGKTWEILASTAASVRLYLCPILSGGSSKPHPIFSMETPEQAVIEGTVNPFTRLFYLFGGSYLIAIFHPLPEAVFDFSVRLAKELNGEEVRFHNDVFVKFEVIPMISAFFSDTILASGLVSIFCIVCSALDRWNVWKTTILGGWSTFLVYALPGWGFSSAPLTDTGVYLLLMALLFTIAPAMRRR